MTYRSRVLSPSLCRLSGLLGVELARSQFLPSTPSPPPSRSLSALRLAQVYAPQTVPFQSRLAFLSVHLPDGTHGLKPELVTFLFGPCCKDCHEVSLVFSYLDSEPSVDFCFGYGCV